MTSAAELTSFHDLEYIGEKIIEMVERVKVGHSIMPGAQAKWVIEVDDVRYNVVVSVDITSSGKEGDR